MLRDFGDVIINCIQLQLDLVFGVYYVFVTCFFA